MHKNILKKVWFVLLALSFFIIPNFIVPQKAYAADDLEIKKYKAYMLPSTSGIPVLPLQDDGQFLNTGSNSGSHVTGYKQAAADGFVYELYIPNVDKGDKIHLSIKSIFGSLILKNIGNSELRFSTSFDDKLSDVFYGSYNQLVTDFDFVVPYNCDNLYVQIIQTDFSYSLPASDLSLTFGLKSISYSVESETSSSISELRDYIYKLYVDTVTTVNDRYNSIMDYISSSFLNFDSRVKQYFSDSKNYVHNEISALQLYFNDKLTALWNHEDEIKDELSSLLSAYSEEIQANADKNSQNEIDNANQNSQNEIDNANQNHDEIMNGDKEYDEYEFSSGLTDVLASVEEYADSLDNTLTQINEASNSASEYISQGTEVVESVFGVFPAMITVLVMFGIVFIFARKVIGR